ncbi:MAG: peptide ABC transporter substrate-binding protein [Thermaerobacter sp.]|nr:peptide ABC transporter substrate-binding protein [Thermaerobacter sp.]
MASPRTSGRMRQWAIASVSALLLAGLSACGGSPTPAAASGVLNIGLAAQGSPNWWPPISPATSCGTLTGGGEQAAFMYMPLLWINRTDQISYPKSIASAISVNKADTVFTIHMKPNWQWSNGQPVTAQNVLFDWSLIKAASSSSSPLPYCFAGGGGVPNGWKSVTAPNSHTVVVTTKAAVNPVWFEHNALAQLVPVPSVWQKYSNMQRELTWIQSIGSTPNNPVYKVVDGPYTIAKAVPDQYWTYVANPKFSGVDKPSIKTVTYHYETSSSNLFAQLHRNALDVAPLPLSLYGQRGQLTSYHVVTQQLFAFFYMTLNFRSNANGIGGLFNKLYIRQALQMGIDQPAIIASIYHGLAEPTVGPVPRYPKNAYFDSAIKGYPYSPQQGKTLLEQHGWHLANGVMTRNGQKLEFPLLFATGSTSRTNMMQLIKQAWAQEGIQVTLQTMAPSAVGPLVGAVANSSKWAVDGDGGWIYVPDYYPTGGELFLPSAGFNRGAYNSSTMNTLIHQTYAGGTTAQIKNRFDAYQVYTAAQLPGLWMPTPESIAAVRDGVHGMRANYNPIIALTPLNELSLGSAQ